MCQCESQHKTIQAETHTHTLEVGWSHACRRMTIKNQVKYEQRSDLKDCMKTRDGHN